MKYIHRFSGYAISILGIILIILNKKDVLKYPVSYFITFYPAIIGVILSILKEEKTYYLLYKLHIYSGFIIGGFYFLTCSFETFYLIFKEHSCLSFPFLDFDGSSACIRLYYLCSAEKEKRNENN